MQFSEFPLHPQLLENLKNVGYAEPTPIQAEVIPIASEGRDVSGLARTGTGKTAAFLIPTIHRLMNLPPERLALVLAPTRELAAQIQEEAALLSAEMNMGTACIVGGMSAEDQIRDLRNGARIIVGTPGRVIDLFKERHLDLGRVDALIFDEADRMFDMGFIRDMAYILGKVNPTRQILLFSATLNYSVLNMIYEYNANPMEINISRDQMTAEGIRQAIYQVGDEEKPAAVVALCRRHAPETGSVIVFVNYKERAPWVAEILTRNGFQARALSSLMSQDKRNHIIQGFKQGKFRALVATDVASRGIDVEDVQLVINFHLPEDAATYVHRIGRTARAGRTGIAVSIASSEDAYNQMRVEEFLGQKIPVEWFEENELPKDLDIPPRHMRDEDDDRPGRFGGRDRGGRGGGRDRGGRDRGGRDRGGRGRERGGREHSREREQPREQAPQELAPQEQEAAIPMKEELQQPREESVARQPEQTREPREQGRERGERGGRDRGGRGRGRDRGRDRERGGRDRGGREYDQTGASERTALPTPITGNPVIYDTSSGKIKNRSESEVAALMAPRKVRRGSAAERGSPNLMKKLSSKVTALFAGKK